MNVFDVNDAVRDATNTLDTADQKTGALARLIIGRLRHCPSWMAKELKRELRDFNMKTGEWNNGQQ